ncbi:T9SS type A sorting domain-containing protein [bacterium]
MKIKKFLVTIIIMISLLGTSVYAIFLQGGLLNLTFKLFSQNTKSGAKLTGGNFKNGFNLGQAVGNIRTSGGPYRLTHNQLESSSLRGQIASTDVHRAFAYPNPYKAYKNHTHITFAGLTIGAKIYIYTISGELIKKLQKDNDTTTDELRWNVRKDNGKKVFSGLYIYIIKNGDQLKKGKLIIIR